MIASVLRATIRRIRRFQSPENEQRAPLADGTSSPSLVVRASLLAMLAGFAARARADERPSAPPALIDSKDVEKLADELVGKAMRESAVPGAVVALVKDGTVLLLKGYGYADMASKRPVAADRTRFFVASMTKPVTATAIMQLVEKHRLDLHADLGSTWPTLPLQECRGRITLAHLLTHSSGIDPGALGYGVPEGAAAPPLGDHLFAQPPVCVRPPGELFVYANRNYTLAGRLIELASGEPFTAYIERRVLLPIGMTHSGFSLPADRTDVAIGYDVSPGHPPRAWPTPLTADLPAGGLLATGADMARFMIAHLQNGEIQGQRVLEPETVRLMHSPAASFHPALPGMTLGFMEDLRHGRRELVHEGYMAGFYGLMTLVPEVGLGVFVEVNGGADTDLPYALPSAILDRYFVSAPAPTPRSSTPGSFARAPALAGTYREAGSLATLEKASALFGVAKEVQVRWAGDHALSIDGARYEEVLDNVFERSGGETRVAFRLGPDGRGEAMVRDLTTFERVPWYGSVGLHRTVLMGSLLVFVGSALVRIFGALRTLRRRTSPRATSEWIERVAGGLVAFLPLAYVGGIIGACSGPNGPYALFFAVPGWLRWVFDLPLLLLLALVVLASRLARQWRHRTGSAALRIHRTALALAAAAFLGSLAYWNLFGFHG